MFHMPVPEYPPIRGRFPDAFVSKKDFFSTEELDRVEQIAQQVPPKRVTVGPEAKVDPEGNLSFVRWLMPNQETAWFYNRILGAVAELNAKAFQFDITGCDEALYHVTYEGKEGGHYNWHIDANNPDKPQRKLAITFQMSDPKDYEGGELDINMTGLPVTAPKERGTLVLFPAFHIHRVRPVTKGVRKALVTWIVGPPLR